VAAANPFAIEWDSLVSNSPELGRDRISDFYLPSGTGSYQKWD